MIVRQRSERDSTSLNTVGKDAVGLPVPRVTSVRKLPVDDAGSDARFAEMGPALGGKP